MSPPDRFGTEPITAWRVWLVNEEGLLVSPAYPAVWTPGERFVARCKEPTFGERNEPRCHAAPTHGCKCGVYGMKDGFVAGIMFNMVQENPELLLRKGMHPVVGRVALWGRILEHAGGYKGQYAYPDMLRTLTRQRATQLAQNYCVETESYE